jgi:3,4-dihydroxy 2-butanone 4-phosphate synthase / GTP cyclohydrolase II
VDVIEARPTVNAHREAFAAVRRAVARLERGEPVVVLDDADREGEGDLVMPAASADPATIAFVLRHTSGILCCAVSDEVADRLALPLMVANNEDRHGTAFTVTVDAADGITTGISAADRAATLRVLADPLAIPSDLVRPGHVFPLRARPGGVLERRGHTESAVDLVTMAGHDPAAMICELVNDDGSVATLAQAQAFADDHDLAAVTVEQLVHVRRSASLDLHQPEAALPTPVGEFVLQVHDVDGTDHVALVFGEVAGADDVLVRVHSECFTGDVLGSRRCDCGEQLEVSMQRIAEEGRGVVVYVRGHEGRGIGLREKVRAYALQDRGLDTVEANLALGHPVDARDYAAPAAVLERLGVQSVRLLTNSPSKADGLQVHGVEVMDLVPVAPAPHAGNIAYLRTKRAQLGHRLALDEDLEALPSSG